MAIGNLFGTGNESNSLYGVSLSSGAIPSVSSFIYFEWFIFKVAASQPATPTGGTWDFLSNTGTPPTGWVSSVSGIPLDNLWFSIAFVDSRNPTNITWSEPGLLAATTSVYATAYADTFDGDGTTTVWTLTADPVTVENLDVSINGVTQVPTVDYTISGTTFTTTTAAPVTSVILVKYRQALPNSYFGTANNVGLTPYGWISATNVQAGFEEVVDDLGAADGTNGSNLIGFKQAGTGAVATTVQDKLRQTVSVKDFGAVCDGVTDDTAAVQTAIDYCATFSEWPTLIVNGRCRLASSVNIDRPVATETSEFIILGEGPGAGFYTTGDVTMFTSSITMTTSPVTEFVTFENIVFETSSTLNESFVLSEKFLRVKFLNCVFQIVRCVVATTYIQTYYFNSCNLRNTHNNFINCAGLYDVVFESCIIEICGTIIRSIDVARGAASLRFTDCVVEAMTNSIVVTSGASGFIISGCYLEANFAPMFNLFASGPTNSSVSVIGNYIYCPDGAVMYYGPTRSVFSAGNSCFPNTLHTNASQITNLISNADTCLDINSNAIPPSDATVYSTINGVYRAGTAATVWSDSANQIAKDVNGNFGIGVAAQSSTRFFVLGADQTSSKYAGGYADGAGNTIMAFRNDRQIVAPSLQNFADDAAAATGGISVGSLYRNGSVVQVRVT